MAEKKLPPVHPGEILKEEFLDPKGISMNKLALSTRMPPSRIGEIAAGRRSVSAETALRLARYFDTTPQFWTNLQAAYDLEIAGDALGKKLEREVRPFGVMDFDGGYLVRIENIKGAWRIGKGTHPSKGDFDPPASLAARAFKTQQEAVSHAATWLGVDVPEL